MPWPLSHLAYYASNSALFQWRRIRWAPTSESLTHFSISSRVERVVLGVRATLRSIKNTQYTQRIRLDIPSSTSQYSRVCIGPQASDVPRDSQCFSSPFSTRKIFIRTAPSQFSFSSFTLNLPRGSPVAGLNTSRKSCTTASNLRR